MARTQEQQDLIDRANQLKQDIGEVQPQEPQKSALQLAAQELIDALDNSFPI